MKKAIKKSALIIAVIILGGFGGVLADRYLFPYLSETKIFSKYEFLKKGSEDVTIINKTEQVFVKEESSIEKISSQAANSVVNIISYPTSNQAMAAKKTAPKNGTGVVVTSDGLIATYFSTSELTGSKYKVLTYDGNSYDAELLGVDSYSNLAFLKTSGTNLPAISFGNSDETAAGEKVVAVGNSFGAYANRYAAGLLSELNREFNLSGQTVSSSEKLEGVFGTDFNMQENLIGGPVVDYAGQTIGLIGSIQKDGREVFFLLPANKIKRVIDKAIKNELATNPVLGIYYAPLNKTFALSQNLPVEKGVLIFSPSGQQGLAIIAGSPAQKAGLEINDIIIAVNGAEINAEHSLSDILYGFKKGDEIELSVLRAGAELKIKVQL